MGTIESFLNILLIFLVVNSIFRYFAFLRARKIMKKMEEDNLKQLKLQVKEEIAMVTDSICGCNLPKSEAYILVKDNKKYYFCSWDCREKFNAQVQNAADKSWIDS